MQISTLKVLMITLKQKVSQTLLDMEERLKESTLIWIPQAQALQIYFVLVISNVKLRHISTVIASGQIW